MDIETLCLCALSFEPATGYDLKQRFEQVYGHFYMAGFGSIYPALGRLAEAGLVDYSATPGPGPRPRKRYRITQRGEAELRERLADAAPLHRVHSDFLLLMLMSSRIEPTRVDELIDERLAQIRAQLESLRAAREAGTAASPGVEFVRDLGQTMLRTAERYLETHRQGLISALEAERADHTPSS